MILKLIYYCNIRFYCKIRKIVGNIYKHFKLKEKKLWDGYQFVKIIREKGKNERYLVESEG